MQVDLYKQVIFTHPEIVQFMSKHVANEAVQKACEETLVQFCRVASTFVNNFNHKSETNQMLQFLQEFDRRQIEMYKSMGSNMMQMSMSIENGMANAGQMIADKVASQLSNLLVTIKQCVDATFDKISVSSISDSLNESIKSWLDASLQMSQKDVQVSILSLETRLREQLTTEVVTPVINNHTKIYDQVQALTSLVSKDSHNMDQLAQQLQTIERDLQSNMSLEINSLKSSQDVISAQINGSSEKIQETKQLSRVQQDHLLNQLQSLPILTKDAINDVLRQLEQQNQQISTVLTSAYQQINDMHEQNKTNNLLMHDLNKSAKDVEQKVATFRDEMFTKTITEKASTKFKGMELSLIHI
jgi:hypothetical protein